MREDHGHQPFDPELSEDEFRSIIEDSAPPDKGNGRPRIVRHPSAIPAADIAFEYLNSRGLGDSAEIRLRYLREDFYRWAETHYGAIIRSDLRADIVRFLQESDHRRTAGARVANEVLANLEGYALVPASCTPPALLSEQGPVPLHDTISLQNGIFSFTRWLRGENSPIEPHSPRYFFLNSLPYPYTPEAGCPTWLRILAELLPDEPMRLLLQEWFGYNLVHDVSLQKFALLGWDAGTGKSTVLTGLRELLGPASVSAVPLESFDPVRTFPLAATVGKLANIAEEISDVEKSAEGLLKTFVSGGLIVIERKHRDAFSVAPTARLTFAANQRPRFADRSDGIWRRMLVIKFEQVIPPEKQDRRFNDPAWWRSSGELPGIFLWALQGLRRLRERGRFEEPLDSRLEREAYKRDANPAGTFLRDHCEENVLFSTPGNKLYTSYAKWTKEQGQYPLSEPQFAQEVRRQFPMVEKQKNATHQPDGTKARLWLGLKFNDGGLW